GARRAEASLQLGNEVGRRPQPVVELLGEPDEAREIGLAHDLAFAELLGQAFLPARVDRISTHRHANCTRVDSAQLSQELPSRITAACGNRAGRPSRYSGVAPVNA